MRNQPHPKCGKFRGTNDRVSSISNWRLIKAAGWLLQMKRDLIGPFLWVLIGTERVFNISETEGVEHELGTGLRKCR